MLLVLGLAVVSSGCAVKFVKRSPRDVEQIEMLSGEVSHLRELARLKGEEADRLREAKALLEERLAKEIGDQQVSVGLNERGLVISFLAEILFDSGQAKLRPLATAILDKVARILREELPDQPVGIEGYTDNEPIKASGWKSNWELSTARATSVLHYLVDNKGVAPERVSAIGYGEYRPVASNATSEGRQQNRRVEVVVLPQAARQRQTTAGVTPPTSGASPAAGGTQPESAWIK